MAGGSGTRFWPRSRTRSPKQLLAIVGSRSMLEETVARIAPLVRSDRVLVVTGHAHAAGVRTRLASRKGVHVLVEPEARNTAAAIALAALHIARRHPKAVMVVLPADHAVAPLKVFRADLDVAMNIAARTGSLVTLGISPTHPETGYGYIQAGAGLERTRGRASAVERFIEKPDRARAAALLAAGGVLWNAGIFAWRVDSILAELRRHVPQVLEPLEAAMRRGGAAARRTAYRRLPAISIDTGVLEESDKVAVVRARFRWSDVGSWAAVAALWAPDGNGQNVLRGSALPIDSQGCVVDSPKRLVALLGVKDLVVVDTPDALLVCQKDRAQDVRLVVDELRRRGLGRYL
jgi:mannose-1-phosphate guanylyltransferase